MRYSIVLTILMLASAPARAHTGAAPASPSASPPPSATAPQPKPVEFKLEKLSSRAYCLYGRGGNIGFLVTDAGVVVVDDQYEEVDVVHVAPGHTDGDSMVYFAKEKVLHMGDLFFNGMVPFIDTLGGGSARGYVTNIDQILTLVPPDPKVIPGPGPVTDVATLRRFETAVKAGRSKPEAVRSIKPTFRTLGNDIIAIYDEVAATR